MNPRGVDAVTIESRGFVDLRWMSMEKWIIDKEKFLKRVNEMYNNKYDYSLVIFNRSYRIKDKIICPTHGIFELSRLAHANNGQGCPLCKEWVKIIKQGNAKRITLQEGELRQCSSCKKHLTCTSFYKSHIIKDGLRSFCKECASKKEEEYKKTHKEKVKERIGRYTKKRWREYRMDNLDEFLSKKLKRILWARTVRQNAKIARIFKSGIRRALKGEHRLSKRSLDLLGCDIDFFRQHIESLFKDGMTWENHSFEGWHLDHIKPIAAFPNIRTSIEEQKKCFHYTNYQPLWKKENMEKWAIYEGVNYWKHTKKTA